MRLLNRLRFSSLIRPSAGIGAVLALLAFFSLSSCGKTARVVTEGTVFLAGQPDTIEFKDKWDDGRSTGAKVEVDGIGRLLVTGINPEQSYGCVYTDLTVDLDKYGAIEIDVDGVSKGCYILLEGASFEQGYVPLGPSITKPGTTWYDLRLQSGYTQGRLPVRLQLGVTTGNPAVNAAGETVLVSGLRFVPLDETPDKLPDEYVLFGRGTSPEAVQRFAPAWDDGKAAGADVRIEGDALVVQGTADREQFGATIVNATVDLDRQGALRLEVADVTRRGYVIVHSPELPGGYARATPEITGAGTYDFDLRRLMGRGGRAQMKILVGVSAFGSAPNALEQRLRLTRAALVPPPVRRIEAVRRVAMRASEAAPPPPAGSPWPDPLEAVPVRAPLAGIESSDGGATPSILDRGDRIILTGGHTEVTLARADGRILSIRDLRSGGPVGSARALFSIETIEGGIINASDAVAAGAGAAGARLTIEPRPGAASVLLRYAFNGYGVDVTATAEKTGVSFSAAVQTHGATVRGLSIPDRLAFPIAGLQEVVTPRYLGVGLGPGFFREQRTTTLPYPAAFSDLLHVRSDRGSLSILGAGLSSEPGGQGNRMRYTGKGISGDSWAGLRPVTLTVSGEGDQGLITRLIPARLAPAQSLDCGRVLFAAGLPLTGATALYRRNLWPVDPPSLATRLGAARFTRYAEASLVKFDFGNYPGIERVLQDLETLTPGVLLHPVTYWPQGFDRHYPDFFPADARFRGDEGLKQVTEVAHRRNMLVVPYVNPTWWTPSPSTDRVGVENFAIRDEKGQIHKDIYGENYGWIASPWSQDVRAVRRTLHGTIRQTLGMDGVFEDQIGARDWRDDLSVHAPAPLSYAEGMRSWAAENPLDSILMTENGFDAIAPFEHGLCGMWHIHSWPDGGGFDDRFGRGNWRVVPVASWVARDLADFMHHDLAVEVRTDNDRKLSWNLAFGFKLFQILYNNLPLQQGQWILINQVFQRELLALTTGKKLIEWSEPAAGSTGPTWTRYEGGVGVLANLRGTAPIELASASIPVGGALAGDGRVVGGTLTRLGDFEFGGARHLVLKRGPGQVDLIAPDRVRELMAIPRDAAWTEDAGIRVTAVMGEAEAPIPYALTDRAVIFLHRPAIAGEARYRVRSETAGWDVRLRGTDENVIAGGAARVRLHLGALGRDTLSVSALELTAHGVSTHGPLPELAGGSSAGMEAINLQLGGGRGAVLDYVVDVPPDFARDERLWVSARIRTNHGEKIVATLVAVTPGFELSVDAPAVVARQLPATARLTLQNRMPQDARGSLVLLVDGEPVENSGTDTPQTIAAGSTWSPEVSIPGLEEGDHVLVARFTTETGFIVLSAPVRVRAVRPLVVRDLDGRNLIPAAGMTVHLKCVAPAGRSWSGVADLTMTGGWTVTPARVNVTVPAGGEVRVPVRITPGGNPEAIVHVRLGGADGVDSFAEPMKRIDDNPAILRGDLNGDGLEEIAFGHRGLEAQCAVALGGRILFLSGEDGVNQLFLPYPAVTRPADPKAWAEYGGINDWWPEGWPGDVWNTTWSVEAALIRDGAARVVLTSRGGVNLAIKRTFRIAPGSPLLAVDYEIANNGSAEANHVWAAHPDVAVGGSAGEEDRVVVPTAAGITIHDYRPKLAKTSFTPQAGWAAAVDRRSGHVLGIVFEPGSLSEVGMWEGVGFFTLEPIRASSVLPPQAREFFSIGYAVGKGDPEQLGPQWAALLSGNATSAPATPATQQNRSAR